MTRTFEEDMLSLYLWIDRRSHNGRLTKECANYLIKEFKRAVENRFPMDIAKYKEEIK